MSKREFTEKEIKKLGNNPYVKSVTSKGITYTEEFKLKLVTEYENGKQPRQIFEEAGFDVAIIGIKRVVSASSRWREAYNEHGESGLRDSRADSSGRTSNRELSLEEKYARLEAEHHLLRAENELLKKIRLAERRLNKKS